jgi:hypothetical protein
MLGNLGIAAVSICILSGAFLLCNGIPLSDLNQVLDGAVALSVGLVIGFLVVKSKLEWPRNL